MSGIFISYRHQDCPSAVDRLAGDLQERLPDTRIFRDVEAIVPGEDFTQDIERALASCGALLAVIGPHWLDASDKDGKRCLDDPNDATHQEILSALQRPGLRVIPVLVEGASMPAANELPDDLAPLARRNAVNLSDKRWQYDIGGVESSLRTALGRPERKAPQPMPWGWLSGVASLLILALGTYFVIQPDAPPAMRDDSRPATPESATETAAVPNLSDQAVEAAVEALLLAGLHPGERHDVARNSPHAVAGRVLRQSREPGALATRGDRIDLWVWGANVALPNVVGHDADKARRALADLGMRAQTRSSETDTVNPGIVIGQTPEGGTEQKPGTPIILNVAKARAPGSRAPEITLNPKVLEILKRRDVLRQPIEAAPLQPVAPIARPETRRPEERP